MSRKDKTDVQKLSTNASHTTGTGRISDSWTERFITRSEYKEILDPFVYISEQEPQARTCGYSLRGITEVRCPECGPRVRRLGW